MVLNKEDVSSEGKDEMNPLLPSPHADGGRFKFGAGGADGLGKTALVSVAVTMVVLVGMAFMGGGSFVTKKDFTSNMQTVATTLKEAQDGYAKAQNDLAVAIGGIPSTVSSQVSSATNALNGQMTSLSNKLNEVSSNSQTNITRVSEMLAKMESSIGKLEEGNTEISDDIVALQAEVLSLQEDLNTLDGLADDVDTLEATLAGYDARIKTLENSITNLGSQFLVVSGNTTTTTMPDGIGDSLLTYSVPLSVTNNGNQTVARVDLKLVVTVPAGVTVGDAKMRGTFTKETPVQSGTTVTLYTWVENLQAGWTANIPMWIQLDYSPSTIATWKTEWKLSQ